MSRRIFCPSCSAPVTGIPELSMEARQKIDERLRSLRDRLNKDRDVLSDLGRGRIEGNIGSLEWVRRELGGAE